MAEIQLPDGIDPEQFQSLLKKFMESGAGPAAKDPSYGPTIFADFEHGTNKRIKVYRDWYKGREILSIRKFWLDTDNDEWKPGKGVTFDYEAIDQIIEGLTTMKGVLENE